MSELTIRAGYRVQRDRMFPVTLTVELTDGSGSRIRAITSHMKNEVDASRLTDAINTFNETKAPSAVHWASGRMRSIEAEDRKVILSMMDKAAGVTEE